MTCPGPIPTLTPREGIIFFVGPKKTHPQLLERIIENTFQAASRPAGACGKAFMTDLLRSWASAGCKADQWQNNNRVMANKLKGYITGIGGFANWRPVLGWEQDGRPKPLLIAPSGLDADAAQNANDDEALAYDLFAVFLFAAAPRAEVRICDRCGRFYWNRWGHANKRFCGRKCSQLRTAIEGQEKRLQAERGQKNKRIRQSIQNFISQKPQASEWRRWVARDADVSLSYLTRAVNRGTLGKPDGVKVTRKQTEYLTKLDKGGK